MRRPSDARLRLLVLVAAVALLAACAPPETDPNALRADDGTPLYRDGIYAASYSHAGPEGWRPFLRIRVRAGLIDEICFDAVNSAGRRLTDAERFLEEYRLASGVVLTATIDDLRRQILETQLPPPRTGPRPVEWAAAFDVLLRTAIGAARVGITVNAAGIEQVPTAGPYVATDAPDELGWRAELVLVYDGDGVAAGSYREVRTERDGTTRVKRDDSRYQEQFRAMFGVTSDLVASTLVDQLLEAGSARIDGVAGATLSTRRFVELATSIASIRRPVPLPSQLCP